MLAPSIYANVIPSPVAIAELVVYLYTLPIPPVASTQYDVPIEYSSPFLITPR